MKLLLGHIEYSNCFPIHALLVDGEVAPGAGGARATRSALDVELRAGIPSFLNAELAAGRVDVAPSSSIEYARHADRYRLLPDLVIGSDGPVESIVFECDRPPTALDGCDVAVPTASATSVVLLRILLELRLGVRPRYRWFDQAAEADPIARGAAGALRIGDAALRRPPVPGRTQLDLGAAWREWTGLPFAFAVWQVSAGADKDPALRALHALLLQSRAYFEANVDALARRNASRYGIAPDRLARYWRGLEFHLDDRMAQGLLHFYRLAAELREVPAVPALHWIPA
ncbi:MAG TPA: menaquinone biosynthesis protein [Longimicrobiales bacterium]